MSATSPPANTSDTQWTSWLTVRDRTHELCVLCRSRRIYKLLSLQDACSRLQPMSRTSGQKTAPCLEICQQIHFVPLIIHHYSGKAALYISRRHVGLAETPRASRTSPVARPPVRMVGTRRGVQSRDQIQTKLLCTHVSPPRIPSRSRRVLLQLRGFFRARHWLVPHSLRGHRMRRLYDRSQRDRDGAEHRMVATVRGSGSVSYRRYAPDRATRDLILP